jgi:homoprotocatechuate degradation regulator HpaR
MPMRDLSDSLPMALLRARESVMRLFRPGLRRNGVTEQQWRVLRALAHAGPLQVTELARTSLLPAPSLSRILQDMEMRQLIRRRQKASDLRRYVVTLKWKGLEMINTQAPYSERVYQQIAMRIGAGRLRRLFTLLHELEQLMQKQSNIAAAASMPGPKSRRRRRATQ